MSPSNINSFVGDLVAMAQAVEKLPQVEQERDDLKEKLDNAQQSVQDRELAIARYKQDIEELNAKVRSLEVERDDASFRVLEAEDAAHAAVAKARSAAAALEGVIAKLEPPKPQPETVKEPEHHGEALAQSLPQGQGEGNPPTSTTETQNTQTVGSEGYSLGQSENHPIPQTASASFPSTENATTQATSTDAGNSGHATSETPSHGPYYGKRYVDVPHYISPSEWREGGGTDEDYHWRPAAPAQRHSW